MQVCCRLRIAPIYFHPKMNFILQNPYTSAEAKKIAQKVEIGERITDEDALYLFEKAELPFLAVLATQIREKKNGKHVYFNRNFHIEPTNVCIYDCKFCSYSRAIKKRGDGWEFTMEEMLNIVKKYDNQHVTEVHIVGGVLPQYDVEFYEGLFQAIRAHRPNLHIKALTPVEYHYIFKKAKISYEEGMKRMVDAGLDSIPGGGAEIFHPEIREIIAKDKCNAEQWLAIHEILHDMGIRSNATMLYGHIEKYWHRVDHLRRLRELQDKTGGFQTFIPLKFRNEDNEMSHIEESTLIEDLKNYAISRIYLDNFDHIKAYWPMISKATTHLALSFGVDDIDGTIDDTTKIYSMAGSEEQNPAMSTQELIDFILSAGYQPIERDTLYNVVHDYSKEEYVAQHDFA